jgi:hypothetical protein
MAWFYIVSTNNGGSDREKKRRNIIGYCGLIGVFVYLGMVEFLGKDFHLEFLLIFAAMMGISIAQGVDKK